MSQPTDDPIFGLIENHRTLAAKWSAIASDAGEREPKSEAEEEADGELADAAIALCDTPPATLAGAIALARYVIEHIDETKGAAWGFPDSLVDDDIDQNGRSYEYFILRSVADAFERFAAEQQKAA